MGDLGSAYELRARLRPLAVSPRVRDCGRRAIQETPSLVVREYGENEKAKRRTWWTGILRCGRQHACPVCNARRAAERASEVDRMVTAAGGRWQMVTLNMKHHRGEGLRELLSLLFKAWRKVRAHRLMRDIFDRRVTATARAVEVTGGFAEDQHGWHPHIHLLLRTTEWDDRDRAVLEWLWAQALGEHAGWAGIAVYWSSPIEDWQSERARYIAKLGAEVAGVGKTAWGTTFGRLGPWQIAEASLFFDDMTPEEREACLAMGQRWHEYQSAMKGRRILELDERAKAFATDAEPEPEHVKEWSFDLDREEYRALAAFERIEPRILWFMVEAGVHSGADPPAELRDWLQDVLTWQKPAAAA